MSHTCPENFRNNPLETHLRCRLRKMNTHDRTSRRCFVDSCWTHSQSSSPPIDRNSLRGTFRTYSCPHNSYTQNCSDRLRIRLRIDLTDKNHRSRTNRSPCFDIQIHRCTVRKLHTDLCRYEIDRHICLADTDHYQDTSRIDRADTPPNSETHNP
jgi:hypothetical protein